MFIDPESQVSPVSPIMYNCSTNRMISLDPIVKFVKKTSAGLPQAQFKNYNIYVVPFIYSAISNGVTLSTGFAIVSKQTASNSKAKVQVKITVNCNTQSEDGILNTNQEIVMYINCNKNSVQSRRRVNKIKLCEENSDLDEILREGETGDEPTDTNDNGTNPGNNPGDNGGNNSGETGGETGGDDGKTDPPATTNEWHVKQYSIDEYYGCALFVGKCNISNLDIETIFSAQSDSDNKTYLLNSDGDNQFKEVVYGTTYNSETNAALVLTCISGTDSTATIFDILNGCLKIKNTTLKELLTQTQMSLFKKSGYISPYINIGSLNYLLVESNDFDLNDFGWDAMYQTYYKNVDQSVYPQNSPDLINDIFKYNMAMLNNKDNEEFNPTLRNPDYISIHTFRKEHGIVDFYFPLNFLFIC